MKLETTIIINKLEWKVQLVEPEAISETRLGETALKNQLIRARTDALLSQIRITISHELVHAYMSSYGILIENMNEEFIADFLANNIDNIYELRKQIFKNLELEVAE